MSPITANQEGNILQLGKVEYEVLDGGHVLHVVFKRFKAFNEHIGFIAKLIDNPQIDPRYYDAEELKKINTYLYYESTGGRTPTLGEGHNDCPAEWRNYPGQLSKEKLKGFVLQFVNEAANCLTEESIQKIVRYVPRKKDGTLAKKRVTLIVKSKWADYEGLCPAMIARNTSDTDIEIEMTELYIGEDKFSDKEAAAETGIRDTDMSSPKGSGCDAEQKKQDLTDGFLISGLDIPKLKDCVLHVKRKNQEITIKFRAAGTNGLSTVVNHVLKPQKYKTNYMFYDKDEYEELGKKYRQENNLDEHMPIPGDVVMNSLKPIETVNIIDDVKNHMQNVLNLLSEENLLKMLDSLPQKTNGELIKYRQKRVLTTPWIIVDSASSGSYATVYGINAQVMTDTHEVLLG